MPRRRQKKISWISWGLVPCVPVIDKYQKSIKPRASDIRAAPVLFCRGSIDITSDDGSNAKVVHRLPAVKDGMLFPHQGAGCLLAMY